MSQAGPFTADWNLLSKRRWLDEDPSVRSDVLRDTARGFQRSAREEKFGLLSTPGDLVTNYREGWWEGKAATSARDTLLGGPQSLKLDFFTPRMAYQTWLGLTIEGDMFVDDFGSYAVDDERIPCCARNLIDGKSAFFWQLSDCFESLIQKIAKGEGPVLSCVGECIALHITLAAVKGFGDGSGGSVCEQLEDDEIFQSLPVMPNDTNFGAWYGWRGPLDGRVGHVARPLALYKPTGFDEWAPVSNDVLEREERYNPFSAANRGRPQQHLDRFDHVGSEAWHSACGEQREAEKRFRQGVAVPTQVLAERADYTEPNQWFRPFPTAVSADEYDDDDLYYDSLDESVTSLPGLPLNRTDGATLHIGLSPFEDGENCFLVTINAFIKLPGVVKPIGEIRGYGVQRSASGHWDEQTERAFFWSCDAVSEEYINAVLTFCDLPRRAAIKQELKAAPCNIPDSCDTGPLISIESVTVDPAHRGQHIGIDALDTLLKNIRWSIAIIDASPMYGSGEETEEQYQTKRLAYRRYFERLGFVMNVPGGYPAEGMMEHVAMEPGEAEQPRYHWLSYAQFSTRTPESELCVVCMEAPREMALVHGDTAHTVCCRKCTAAIQAADNKCPACMQPISAVFRNFN
jgi:hypothetical protein